MASSSSTCPPSHGCLATPRIQAHVCKAFFTLYLPPKRSSRFGASRLHSSFFFDHVVLLRAMSRRIRPSVDFSDHLPLKAFIKILLIRFVFTILLQCKQLMCVCVCVILFFFFFGLLGFGIGNGGTAPNPLIISKRPFQYISARTRFPTFINNI